MSKIKSQLFIFLFFILIACQKVEILDDIVFDYNQFVKIDFVANTKNINVLYETKYNDLYIDHSLKLPPKFFLKSWLENNLNTNKFENALTINILNASLKKSEITNLDETKYKEKTIFLFEINFLTEYILYSDSNTVLSNVIVEAKRTITSGKFISIKDSERIIDNLIFECLIDFSNKSNELIRSHMSSYIL